MNNKEGQDSPLLDEYTSASSNYTETINALLPSFCDIEKKLAALEGIKQDRKDSLNNTLSDDYDMIRKV